MMGTFLNQREPVFTFGIAGIPGQLKVKKNKEREGSYMHELKNRRPCKAKSNFK